MQSLTTAKYSSPSGYELTTQPRPVITQPTDVVFRVHAASINPVDVKLASGVFKQVLPQKFPMKIGYDCAGIVTEVGSSVTKLKVGDEVYSRLPEVDRGSWSEYARTTEEHVALKPKALSFPEAAALPLAAVTAIQALRRYNGSLEGKTVFIPAGLGGTGAYACQAAKNVFKAAKVITTVSTSKVDKVAPLLGDGVVDQIIDYTKNDPLKVISEKSVDFIFDTTGQAMQFLPLVTPATGMIISVSTQPSAADLQHSSFFKRPDKPTIPVLPRLFLNGVDAVSKLRARRYGVQYSYMFLESSAAELDQLTRYVEDGHIKPVIGSSVDFGDLEKVKAACQQVYDGKGGIGKTVFVMAASTTM